VYHPARRTIGELFVKWDRHIQHKLRLARQRPLWQIPWTARTMAILISPPFSSMKVLKSDRIFGISARFKAIGVLSIVRIYRGWKMLHGLFSHEEITWNKEESVNSIKNGDVAK